MGILGARPALLLASALLAVFQGCARPVARATASRDGEILARVGGGVVTRGEVERRAALQLRAVQQEEYDVLHEATRSLLVDRLEQQEAAKRGTSVGELIRAEVDAKLPPEDPREVEAAYEANKARLAGRDPSDARNQVRAFLRNRRLEERRRAFDKALMVQAGARITLEPPRSTVAIPKTAPSLGPPGAPVTIVEFSDYQCPFCQKAEDAVEEVLQRNAGRVRLVSLDFPLKPRALPAAAAAHCAGEQGRYWEYHRSLLSEPGSLGDSDLAARAAALRLDASAFQACLRSGRHDSAIRSDSEQGASLGVDGTPTFFVNGRRLVGARAADEFQEIIDSELQDSPNQGP